ncbi:MAG TPA: HAMP domain-containing sensor histidine kinase [Chitinophagaceae bacterium]|nr:HAMP domain-containing sensor histidine kinase [Chitinophagaceae bacterium]
MFKGLSILMVVAISAIAGFQIFWLRENYIREKRDLGFKSNVVFKETVRRLQSKKLNLDKVFNDSTGKIRIEMINDRPFPIGHPGELTNVLNDVTIRVKDSLSDRLFLNKPKTIVRKGIRTSDSSVEYGPKRGNLIISMNETFSRDSNRTIEFERRGPPAEVIRFLYSVDSLQDSLKVKEIDSACRVAFKKEKIDVPITITKNTATAWPERLPQEDPKMLNKVTIGFAHPVTYELSLGNSFGYIMKRLASPILFSLFLISVTVSAFVLLYRNLRRQRRLTNIKNEFISNITHELKTPIATVGVAIEALRNFNAINDPQRTKEYLDISQNELHRLSLLVDKVLKLSMFEKKEIELKYEPVDLKDVVNEVVSSMKLQIEKHQATISVNAEGDTSMQGDRLHLLSVVFNLLDNALKYGNGSIAVKFDMKEKENEIELSVADNGIGISQEYKNKVFEKFFRVPLGNTHNTKGYGLGLSYVAHVVQKHKGKIEIESQPGIGSKFIITLPKAI